MHLPTVLTIAGSDSSGGAGIQGDLKTLGAFGVHGLSVLTSVTAQDTRGVQDVFDLPAEFVVRQMRTLVEDIQIGAVKTGMLSNRDIIEAVALEIKRLKLRNIVVDPVMRAKSGTPLITAEAQKTLLEEIIPLARVVIPNVPEAEELCGFVIRTVEQMKDAAQKIACMGAQSVLVKGGHMERLSLVIDILYDGHDFYEFSSERLEIPGGVHGTGCAFSSAVAAGLAKGYRLIEAVSQAKFYITEAIRYHYRIGHGYPVLKHDWNSRFSTKPSS